MAELKKTNLVIVAAPLPPDFEGDPQEFYDAMVERMEIQSPVGTNFFIVGDVEPSTNLGPWLKNGTQWWVFDDTLGRYVPLDISASLPRLLTVSDTEPETPLADDAKIWIRTSNNRVVGLYFWTGSEWRPDGGIPPSGPTADRPTVPVDLEQFFDTDINVLIHWERGAWRTVSGSPGDVKFVSATVLAAAITINPGWEYLGESSQDYRGKVLGVATKDPGATPTASYTTASGISTRASGDIVGTETHVLASDEIEQHTHLVGGLTALHSDNLARFYRVDDGETFSAPPPAPPNNGLINGSGGSDGSIPGQLPSGGAGTMFVTSKQLSISAAADYTVASQPHQNMQPTVFLWALRKI